MKLNFLTFALFFGILLNIGNGQCSDAGVCAIGGGSYAPDAQNKNTLSLKYIFGYSDKESDIRYNTMQVEGKIYLFAQSDLFFYLPLYSYQNGPLGSVGGVGDAILIWGQKISENLKLNGGLKLATGDENSGANLPQTYQPGLGTNDILLGLTYGVSDFSFSAAYQYVEKKRNENVVTRLLRGDDLFLKGSYLKTFDAFSISGEIMGIQRLQKSSVLDSSSVEESFITVDDDQLQINLGIDLRYRFSDRLDVNLYAAFPLLQREVNVDGLKRSFSFNLGLNWYY